MASDFTQVDPPVARNYRHDVEVSSANLADHGLGTLTDFGISELCNQYRIAFGGVLDYAIVGSAIAQ
jgi:hypothetical protein